MRLWHKDLIPVLPDKQLKGQWCECCCVARNIVVNGTPNHILVNKVIDYSSGDFVNYCGFVVGEMQSRGYKVSVKSQEEFMDNVINATKYFNNKVRTDTVVVKKGIFVGWHNDRYFWQCYYNLQEKYDCGGISEEEWHKIYTYARYVKAREPMKIIY